MTGAAADLRKTILDVMRTEAPLTDSDFDQLAVRTFQHQFDHNAPYRRYCRRRGVTPADVAHWTDIPAVPTAAFKETALVAGDATAAQAIFRTSGTTRGVEKRGAHHVLDLELYRRSALATFRRYVLPDAQKISVVSLIPPWQSNPDSSLSYMTDLVVAEFAQGDPTLAMTADGLDIASLHASLARAREQLLLLGTSLAFVHWFDALEVSGRTFVLPAGSRVMDTGGFKGSTRAITSEALRDKYGQLLGIPRTHVVNEYGMTEMCSQFYDGGLRGSVTGEQLQPAAKHGGSWVRTAVVDPESLVPVPSGEVGILRHFDLANIDSVSAIQTEDLGRVQGTGFQLMGRITGAAPRGCSIAMDLFLSHNQ